MKWKHFYSLLQRTQTETSLGQILGHFLNKYTSALYAFQHVGHKHVSVYSFMPFLLQPATVSFADWGQKGVFQLSAMTPWYFPYLTDLMLKLFQCTKSWSAFLHRAFKEKTKQNNTEFLLLPFTCPILYEVALSPLSPPLIKETSLSSACCLAFLFTYCLSKQQEVWFVGDPLKDIKAPGLGQESSCVYISRDLETFVYLQEADKQSI